MNDDSFFQSDSSASPNTSDAGHFWSQHEQSQSASTTEWPGHWIEASFVEATDPEHRASWPAPVGEKQVPRLRSIPNSKLPRPQHTESNQLLLESFANAVQLVPSISFAVESELWQIHMFKLANRFHSLRLAMLSFAATYMHFLTEDNSFVQTAIEYRGAALQALQHDMHKGGKDGLDAAIGSSILLADQSALEGDWKACILHSRGLNNLCCQASIKDSIFATTRSPKPQLIQQQHRRYDTKAIRSTPDGSGCYNSLCNLQSFFSKMACVNLDDALTRDFIGLEIDPRSQQNIRHDDFSYGGVGHMIALACSVHTLHRQIESDTDRSAHTTKLMHKVLEIEQEGKDWLECAPRQLITRAFDSDPASLVLIAYKSALDLLLHRCKLLLIPVLLPSPTAMKAIKFISEAYELINSQNRDDVVWECMAWPLWVLSWANTFGNRTAALSIAKSANARIFQAF